MAEQAHAIKRPSDHTGFQKRAGIDRRASVQFSGVDRLLHAADIYCSIGLPEYVVEAALGQAHVQRHLSAFKAADRDAGPGILALVAGRPAVLPLPEPMPRPDPRPRLSRALVIGQFVEFHRSKSAVAGGLHALPIAAPASVLDAHQMVHLADHPAHGRRVFQLARPVHLVEAQTDQRRALILRGGRSGCRSGLPAKSFSSLPLRLLRRPELRLQGAVVLFAGFAAILAAPDDIADLLAPARRDIARRLDLRQRIEGRLDHIVRVRGADRFGNDVVDSDAFENRPHRAARNDARSRRRRPQHDLAGAVTAFDVV